MNIVEPNYERFVELLEARGITAYQVSKDTGINRSTFTDWKNGRSRPAAGKLYVLAKYFGVDMEYFMEGTTTCSTTK